MRFLHWKISPALLGVLFFLAIGPKLGWSDTVSFLVDPAGLPDTNGDGFLNGSDLQLTGTDGTVFSFVPTNNLTGLDRFILSEDNGLQFGGGGGSSLSFDFSVNQDVSLEQYTLGNGFFLSNPSFNILEGATILSSTNTSNGPGDIHSFNGGSIDLTAGTTYSFDVQVSGAAVQSFLGSFTYSSTAVPEPTGTTCLLVGAMAFCSRRRR